MPQFDFYSFVDQTFWTILGFLSFYFLILRFYLVNFSKVFKLRQKLNNLRVNKTNIITFKSKLYTFLF